MTGIALTAIIVLLILVLIEIKRANRRQAEVAQVFRVPFGAEGPKESWLWYTLSDVRESLVTILRRTSYLREVRNSLAVLQVYANKLNPEVDLDGYVIDRLAELERLLDHEYWPLNEKEETLYKMLQPHVETWRDGASCDEWDEVCEACGETSADPITPFFRSEISGPQDDEGED